MSSRVLVAASVLLAGAVGGCGTSGVALEGVRTSAHHPPRPVADGTRTDRGGGWSPESLLARSAPTAAGASEPTPARAWGAPGGPGGDAGLDDGLGWYAGVLRERVSRSAPPEDAPGSVNISRVTTTFEGSDFDPVVSRDGSFLVFASTQHRATADLYLKRPGSSTLTQLTTDPGHDMMPSISPDGRWVAFTSNRSGSWDIYVMGIDGGRALQVTSDPSPELHPSWSPDGNSLVFCRLGAVSGRWELWVVDLRRPTVAHCIGEGLFPEWCPTPGTGAGGADRIVYQRSRERGQRSFGVWTIDYADGQASNPMLVASSPERAFINPTWSPDGRWIAFAGVPARDVGSAGGSRPARAGLYLASVEGGGLVPLTSGRGVDLMPTWAPDGTLYFISDRAGHDNVWMMPTAPAIATASGRVPGSGPVFTRTPTDEP